MPRKRQIDPAFFSDDKLVEVPIEAAYLYLGTWCWADDAANIEGSASQWRLWIFPGRPVTTEQVTEWQAALVKIRRILLYSVNGSNYYHLPNLLKHQTIQYPSKPRCPAPPDGILNEGSMSTPTGLNESVIFPSRIEQSRVELNRIELSRVELNSGAGAPPPPLISREDKEIIQIWIGVKNFKAPFTRCFERLVKLKAKHPDINLFDQSEKWAIYKEDHPLTATSSPLSQISTWMGNVKKFEGDRAQGQGKISEEDTQPRSYKTDARIRDLTEKARAGKPAPIGSGKHGHTNADIWEKVLGVLEGDINKANYDTWLRDTLLLDVRNGIAIVGVPSVFAREWLEKRLKSLVVKTLLNVIGTRIEVEFWEIEPAGGVAGVRVSHDDLCQRPANPGHGDQGQDRP
ncbi:hypothetical protein LCGC14_0481040 [marine sediment metagenome]|uniref:DnaA N-terminal domain-containing protein n=1 Tax=marine sediment metagenome TaxID=412755 RepID=A0A0F9S9C8_9ZZZZ